MRRSATLARRRSLLRAFQRISTPPSASQRSQRHAAARRARGAAGKAACNAERRSRHHAVDPRGGPASTEVHERSVNRASRRPRSHRARPRPLRLRLRRPTSARRRQPPRRRRPTGSRRPCSSGRCSCGPWDSSTCGRTSPAGSGGRRGIRPARRARCSDRPPCRRSRSHWPEGLPPPRGRGARRGARDCDSRCVVASVFHHHRGRDAVFRVHEIRRPAVDPGARCALVAAGRRHAVGTGEVGHVGGPVIELEAKRDEFARHVVRRDLHV